MKKLLRLICVIFALVSPVFADNLSGVVVMSATADDDFGVAGVQFQVDGANYGEEIGNPPYSVTWDTRTVSDGPHTVEVIARDAAGNLGKYLKSITVDNTAPTISLTSPNAGAIVSGTAVTVSASVSDNVGLDEVQFQVDGVNLGVSRNRLNVAMVDNGATVRASSTIGAEYPENAVIDGDRKGVFWSSGGGWNDATPGAFPDILELAFDGTKTITEVDIFTVQDAYASPIEPFLGLTFTRYGITTFQVQYWDGESWVLIPGADVSGNNQVWRQIKFTSITTSRIRICITGSADIWSRLTEVEAYSDGIVGADTDSPHSVVWDTTTVSNGVHSLTAIARDVTGHLGSSLTRIVTVNNDSSHVPPVPFVKIGPSNAITAQPLDSVLTWGNSSDATSFEFCMDTTNDNSCDSSWTSTTGTTAALSGLISGKTYWWQVRARNNSGTTDADSGTWWNFTTSVVARINLAAAASGSVASASSVISDAYPPLAAINSDRKGTPWGRGGGWNDGTPDDFPDWLQVDFAGPQKIGEVNLFTVQDNFDNPVEPYLGLTFSQYGVTAFQIQYWDGLSWMIVPGGNIVGNNQVWRQIVFAPVTTPRLRIYITGALNSWSRITEVEAYSEPGGMNELPGPFLKHSPANVAAGQDLNPRLAWGASSGATGYEYCVDTTNNSTCDTSWTRTAISNTAIDGLKAGTRYYWQVRALNSVGATQADIGAWWSFTTLFGGAVNVAAAINGGTASASSFLNAEYAPSGTIDGDRKGTVWASGGGWNDGTPDEFPDWLQVDFAGPQSINEVNVFTVQDAFANPVEPYLGMTFNQWGITSFQVQYWDGLSWAVLPDSDITGNNEVWHRITFSAITTQRIRVLVTGAQNAWSRITEVEAYSDLSDVPGSLSKINLTNSSTVAFSAPTLSWKASRGASSYEYCVDTTDNNSCDTTWTSTTNTDTPPISLNAGTYYWQVRARNGASDTEADNGTWWSFTMEAPPI